MKQFFSMTILLLCCTVFSIQAQQIHFTDTSNRWIVHSSHYDEGTGITFHNDTYIRLKDTLVDGENSYMFCFSEDGIDFICNNSLILTEDTISKKVYGKPFSLEDTATFVLYDFMMNEGDTIHIFSSSSFGGPGIYDHICTEVYPSILIEGVAHRAFEVSDGCNSYTVIEGVGSLLFPDYPKVGCAERTTYDLICFEHNNIRPVFSDLFINECYLSIDNQEVSKPTINLSPNPASGLLNISASQPGRSYPFSICDITGRQVYRGVLKEQAILDIAVWQSGMYIVRITDEKGNTTIKKFIKH